MDGAEQLSGVQSEDLIGMIRYAEKSRMSAILFKSFQYVSSLVPLYQFTVKYMSVLSFLLQISFFSIKFGSVRLKMLKGRSLRRRHCKKRLMFWR
jgi:hypothetical protein